MKISPVQNNQTNFIGKYKTNNYVADQSGRFYAGMTLEEAQLDGTDKSFWRRDFNNLDKDKDGVLSVDEIFKERDHAIYLHKIDAALFAIWGLFDLFTSSKHKKLFLFFDAIIILGDLLSIQNISDGNKRYKRMMAENSESKASK